jgi:acetyltransferase EpsM
LKKSRRKLIVLGAGGFARQIQWIAQRTEQYDVLGFLDETIESVGTLNDLPVYQHLEEFGESGNGEVFLISAVGDINLRRRWHNNFSETYQFTNLIDPSVIIAPNVRMGSDVILLANNVCGNDCIIGNGVHINWVSIVSHDVCVGDFCNIAASVKLTGGCQLGEAVDMGTNSVVLPNVSIGDRAIIGAGAVVTQNIPKDCTAVGVPAKIIKSQLIH